MPDTLMLGDLALRLGPRPQPCRKPKAYGNAQLSVQASSTHYCVPKVDGRKLWEYSLVEVAIIDSKENLVLPSDIGLDSALDSLFEDGKSPVAGYVSQSDLNRLRAALRLRQKHMEQGFWPTSLEPPPRTP